MMTRAKCGTPSGYVTHRNAKQEACEECKEAKRIESQAWRNSNVEKDRIAKRHWSENNKNKIQIRNKKYKIANPDKFSEWKRRRRALERGNLHEPYSVKQVLESYGSDCHLCGLKIDLKAPRTASIKGYEFGLQVDHVIPLAKGGSDNLENVRPSHAICNMRKGARHGEAINQ
jgi:5-methylcytosine-specific restriction endonuclease McrA